MVIPELYLPVYEQDMLDKWLIILSMEFNINNEYLVNDILYRKRVYSFLKLNKHPLKEKIFKYVSEVLRGTEFIDIELHFKHTFYQCILLGVIYTETVKGMRQ